MFCVKLLIIILCPRRGDAHNRQRIACVSFIGVNIPSVSVFLLATYLLQQAAYMLCHSYYRQCTLFPVIFAGSTSISLIEYISNTSLCLSVPIDVCKYFIFAALGLKLTGQTHNPEYDN